MQIQICHNALNQNWSDWFLHQTYFKFKQYKNANIANVVQYQKTLLYKCLWSYIETSRNESQRVSWVTFQKVDLTSFLKGKKKTSSLEEQLCNTTVKRVKLQLIKHYYGKELLDYEKECEGGSCLPSFLKPNFYQYVLKEIRGSFDMLLNDYWFRCELGTFSAFSIEFPFTDWMF